MLLSAAQFPSRPPTPPPPSCHHSTLAPLPYPCNILLITTININFTELLLNAFWDDFIACVQDIAYEQKDLLVATGVSFIHKTLVTGTLCRYLVWICGMTRRECKEIILPSLDLWDKKKRTLTACNLTSFSPCFSGPVD
jgi:hypothetical protein